MKTRVYWSNQERAALIKAARSLGPPVKGDTEEVWKKAQELAGFPATRRRPFHSLDAAKMNAERRRVEEKPPPPALPVEPAVVTPPPAPPPEIVPPLVEAARAILKEIVVGVLYDTDVRAALRDFVQEALAPETEEIQTTGVLWRTSKTPGRERLPRVVLVTGGKAATVGVEQLRALARVIDVRVFNSRDEHDARLQALLPGADAVVVMPTTVSHRAWQIADAWQRKTGKRYIQWNRNIAGLVEELPNLIGGRREES